MLAAARANRTSALVDKVPMNEMAFINFALEKWQLLFPISIFCVAALWFSVRDKIVAGVFDPFTLIFVGAFGINYGVVVFMYLVGLLDGLLFSTLALYAVLLVCFFRWGSSLKSPPLVFRYLAHISQPRLGLAVFTASVLIYGALSLLIFSQIGFGISAETNRFDAARGYGAFIRVLDCLSPFIVAYSTLTIIQSKNHRMIRLLALATFILYAAVVNGAKISLLYSFSTAFLALSMASYRFRMSGWQVAMATLTGLAFSAFALNINLESNNARQQGGARVEVSTDQLVERYVYRFVAFGDTSYLLLPNKIIDNVQTDSIGVRFMAPVVGNGNLSTILGYDVAEFSVGRQALTYYNPDNEISGGPTSHFDLFAYVYFGPFGGIFVSMLLGYILGRINRTVRLVQTMQYFPINKLMVSLVATLWSRAVLLVIEPTVALAYIVDFVVLFTIICLFVGIGRAENKTDRTPLVRTRIL